MAREILKFQFFLRCQIVNVKENRYLWLKKCTWGKVNRTNIKQNQKIILILIFNNKKINEKPQEKTSTTFGPHSEDTWVSLGRHLSVKTFIGSLVVRRFVSPGTQSPIN